MRAEFYRVDSPDKVVGVARWLGAEVEVDAGDTEVRGLIDAVFRRTPVLLDDPSLRSYGTAGPVVLPPGNLRWFEAAARARAEAQGLAVRLVPDGGRVMGFDPAGLYRAMAEQMERRERPASQGAGSAS